MVVDLQGIQQAPLVTDTARAAAHVLVCAVIPAHVDDIGIRQDPRICFRCKVQSNEKLPCSVLDQLHPLRVHRINAGVCPAALLVHAVGGHRPAVIPGIAQVHEPRQKIGRVHVVVWVVQHPLAVVTGSHRDNVHPLLDNMGRGQLSDFVDNAGKGLRYHVAGINILAKAGINGGASVHNVRIHQAGAFGRKMAS